MVNEAQKRTPKTQWDRDNLFPYDARDHFYDAPDGTYQRIRYIGGKENYTFGHSSGSSFSYNGGKEPKSGEANAGTYQRHTAENSCSSVGSSTMTTNHNGNTCRRTYGHQNQNDTHDLHHVQAKNSSRFTNGQQASYTGGSKNEIVKGDNSSGQTQGEAGNKGGRGYSILANRVMLASNQGAFQISTFRGQQGSGQAQQGGQQESGDIHLNSGRKAELVSKDDQNFIGGKDKNAVYQGQSDHEAKKDDLYTAGGDMVHAVPNSFQYLGQTSKNQKEGCFVLTVCGPAKKVKALA